MCGQELKDFLLSLTPLTGEAIEALDNGSDDVLLMGCTPDGIASMSLAEIKACTIKAFCEGLKEYRNCEEAEADGVTTGGCWKTSKNNSFGLPAGVMISQP